MHHSEDTTWKEEDITDSLNSNIPANFYSVITNHYRERLREIERKGMQHTSVYFFIRKNLEYYQQQAKY